MDERLILEELLNSLVNSHRSIQKKLPYFEEGNSGFTTILNSQAKITRSILDCISLMRDPKLQLTSTSRGKLELAKMMESVERAENEVHKIQLMTYKNSSKGRVLSGKEKRPSMIFKKAR